MYHLLFPVLLGRTGGPALHVAAEQLVGHGQAGGGEAGGDELCPE